VLYIFLALAFTVVGGEQEWLNADVELRNISVFQKAGLKVNKVNMTLKAMTICKQQAIGLSQYPISSVCTH
jgi:hypothetical protein